MSYRTTSRHCVRPSSPSAFIPKGTRTRVIYALFVDEDAEAQRKVMKGVESGCPKPVQSLRSPR